MRHNLTFKEETVSVILFPSIIRPSVMKTATSVMSCPWLVTALNTLSLTCVKAISSRLPGAITSWGGKNCSTILKTSMFWELGCWKEIISNTLLLKSTRLTWVPVGETSFSSSNFLINSFAARKCCNPISLEASKIMARLSFMSVQFRGTTTRDKWRKDIITRGV